MNGKETQPHTNLYPFSLRDFLDRERELGSILLGRVHGRGWWGGSWAGGILLPPPRRVASIFWFFISMTLQPWLVSMRSILLHDGCWQQPPLPPTIYLCTHSLIPLFTYWVISVIPSLSLGSLALSLLWSFMTPGSSTRADAFLTQFCLTSNFPFDFHWPPPPGLHTMLIPVPTHVGWSRVPWTEELSGLQSMGSQSQTQLSD